MTDEKNLLLQPLYSVSNWGILSFDDRLFGCEKHTFQTEMRKTIYLGRQIPESTPLLIYCLSPRDQLMDPDPSPSIYTKMGCVVILDLKGERGREDFNH